MFSSAFVPNASGKKLKILNLTISEALINGVMGKTKEDNCDNDVRTELQGTMLKIFPLVIATSFEICEKDREIRYEYLISQALMKVIWTCQEKCSQQTRNILN